MEMDWGTALFGIITMALCTLPFVIDYRNRKKKEKHMLQTLKDTAQKQNCPDCNHEPRPDGNLDIILTEKICVGGEYPGQGRLFGKLYVMPI